MQLKKNYFSISELRCPCCGLYNLDYKHLLNINSIRHTFKLPILVNSCCRCKLHNKEVGGVKNSKHICSNTIKCKATDIRPVDKNDLHRLYLLCLESKLFEDVILYLDKNFIHCESR